MINCLLTGDLYRVASAFTSREDVYIVIYDAFIDSYFIIAFIKTCTMDKIIMT